METWVFAALLGGLALSVPFVDWLGDDDDNDRAPEPEPEPEQPDPLDGTQDWTFEQEYPGEFSHVSGGEGDYYFVGDNSFGRYDQETGEDVLLDSLPGLVEIEGTGGNDRIAVEGDDVLVWSSGGDDRVDAGNLSSGLIFANAGDTVIGSDVADAEVHVDGSDYRFVGGAAADDVFVRVTTGAASGGDGADTIHAAADGRFSGDAGDDVLVGNYNALQYAPTATDNIRTQSGDAASWLDGDAGDDQIAFDAGDTISGGEGADSLSGYIIPDGETAFVTDFNPAEGSLTIWLDEKHTDQVTLETVNGSTRLMQDGHELVRIEGQTGLTVGYTDIYNSGVHDAAGNPIDPNSVDLIIGRYPSITS